MPLDGTNQTQLQNPFSLASLIAWLETQDPATEYDYTEPQTCLLTAYFAAHGISRAKCGSSVAYDTGTEIIDLRFSTFWEIANCGLVISTYGEALARAKALQAQGAL